MQRISPCLWFDSQAEEAARFYVSLFDDASMGEVTHYNHASGEAANKPVGSVMSANFTIGGQEMMALNGGPAFSFNDAISLTVQCHDQAEIDRFWSALTSNGGEEGEGGRLRDKFGLSWQLVPERLGQLLKNTTKEQAEAVTDALVQMNKIDIASLEEAATNA